MTPKELKELQFINNEVKLMKLETRLTLARYALESATHKSFYEGANKKETVDLCIEWAKRTLESIE